MTSKLRLGRIWCMCEADIIRYTGYPPVKGWLATQGEGDLFDVPMSVGTYSTCPHTTRGVCEPKATPAEDPPTGKQRELTQRLLALEPFNICICRMHAWRYSHLDDASLQTRM